MIMKLSKKSIYIAIAASVIMVCVVASVAIFVLSPQHKAIAAVEESIEEIEQKLTDTKTKKHDSIISALKQKLSLAGDNLKKYVVSPKQASDLTVDINRLAKQAGLGDIESTNRMEKSYGPINECRHIREGRILIKFKSSFIQFATFINSLERNTPVIFVDSFKIIRSTANDGSCSVDMVLTFFVGENSLTDIVGAAILSDVGPAAGAESVVN